MDDNTSNHNGSPQKKKIEALKPPLESPAEPKTAGVDQGAFQKLHQVSIGSKLSELTARVSEQVSRLKTEAALSITGFKASDIVDKLPSDVVESLARGKELHDAQLANPALKLDRSQTEMVAKYSQYHDKIVNEGLSQNSATAMLIDRKTMIDELNESISARYRNENKVSQEDLADSGPNGAQNGEQANKQKPSQPASDGEHRLAGDSEAKTGKQQEVALKTAVEIDAKASHDYTSEVKVRQDAKQAQPQKNTADPGSETNINFKAEKSPGFSNEDNRTHLTHSAASKTENWIEQAKADHRTAEFSENTGTFAPAKTANAVTLEAASLKDTDLPTRKSDHVANPTAKLETAKANQNDAIKVQSQLQGFHKK